MNCGCCGEIHAVLIKVAYKPVHITKVDKEGEPLAREMQVAVNEILMCIDCVTEKNHCAVFGPKGKVEDADYSSCCELKG